MITLIRAISNLLLGALTSLMLASAAMADDTEVFFARAASDITAQSNVLFVLDTSGSMGNTDGTGSTRMTRMKSAVRTILENATDINVGLMRFSGKNGGGPVLYPSTALEDIVCFGPGCIEAPDDTPTIETTPANGMDDVEERLATGQVDEDGNTLSLGRIGPGSGFSLQQAADST